MLKLVIWYLEEMEDKSERCFQAKKISVGYMKRIVRITTVLSIVGLLLLSYNYLLLLTSQKSVSLQETSIEINRTLQPSEKSMRLEEVHTKATRIEMYKKVDLGLIILFAAILMYCINRMYINRKQ